MRKLYFLIVTLLVATFSFAQVSAYTFTQSSGTYTPIAGTALGGATWDDGNNTNVPIGFTFNYNGTNYTTVTVNSNGYLTFGTGTSTSYTPLSTTSTNVNGVVAAMARDLINNGAALTSATSGTSGNQIFTAQWNNARRYSGGGVAGDVLNFQIRLLENGNKIEIIYGTNTATSTTSLTTQVGIRGATTDYNNRTSATDWAATTAGATNAATVTTSNTIMPASGLTFTFAPPPPCVAPAAQATSLILTTVSASQVNGSFTAAAGAPTGYLVVAYPVGSMTTPPVNGTTYSAGSALGNGIVVSSGTGTSFNATGLNGGTNYDFYVYSYNSTACLGGPVFNTGAPLSGSALTNPCSFSGTKTIGAAGDYPSLTAALAALTSAGASGNVVFELQADYSSAAETFPIVIGRISCLSAASTLTIRPAAGVTASITGSVASLPLIRILGSYVTIDGSNSGGTSRNLTISNTSTTAPNVVVIGSTGAIPVTNVSVKNSVLINGVNTSSAVIVSDGAAPGTAGNFSNISLLNNSVEKAYIGIYAIATVAVGNGSGLLISDNDLNASGANAIRFAGIYVQGVNGGTIRNNEIGNFNGTNGESDKGIWLATGSSNIVVDRNTISGLNYTGTGGYGGTGVNITTVLVNAEIMVSNNMISNISGDGWNYTTIPGDNPIGIGASGAQTGISLYHNSIHLYGNTLNKTSAMSMGIYLGTGSVANIRNNIIVNNLGLLGAVGYGSSAIYAATANTQFSTINYNNYYVAPTGTGGKYLVQISTTGQTALAGVQTATGGDAASKDIQPTFTSNTDLHLDATANAALDNLATPITTVNRDIDDQLRSDGAPDMGADEFGSICFRPAVTTQPLTQALCEGATLNLSVAASNTTSYQWQFNGVDIPGATSSTYSLSNVTPATAGDYTVILSGSGGCVGPVTSAAAAISINNPVVITTQPSNQSACDGTNVTFSVAATGTGLMYQWQKGGVNISGATASTYTITGVASGDAGSYTVVVSGACGNPVTSNAVTLATNSAPIFSLQPLSQGVCVGSNVTLTATASGSGLAYQWYKNGVIIPGANADSYTVTGFVAGDAGDYSVSATSPCAFTTTSNDAVLSVNVNTSITTQPTTQVSCLGTTATFSVVAAGSGVSYQWRKGGVAIAGATSATYTINAVASADAGNYDVVVTGACNVETSSSVALVVTNPPVIISQPTNQTACVGGSASFTVGATGTGLTYQWFNGTTAISGATNATYTINPVAAANAGAYSVRISGICGTPINSIFVNLTLNAPVAITTQPASQSVCANSNVTFTVAATGTGLTYQWRRNGVNIAGANAATYTINNVTAAAAGDYTVVVTGTCSTVTSSAASLVVNPAIQLTGFVGSSNVCTGSTANYSVTAASSSALTYQWRKNGVAIAGATNAAFSIASVAAADAGNYDVVINGLGGCTFTTSAIALTVNASCVTAVPTLNADVTSVVLMPNVVRQNATLKVNVRRAMRIDWTVSDAQGRVVMRFNQQVAAGQDNLLTLQAAKLASGSYQLNGFTSNGKTTLVRFVKL